MTNNNIQFKTGNLTKQCQEKYSTGIFDFQILDPIPPSLSRTCMSVAEKHELFNGFDPTF